MLDHSDTLRSGGDAGAAARSEGRGQAPPPPTPADGERARKQRKADLDRERAELRKRERRERWDTFTAKLRGVNRQVWLVGGLGVGAVVVGWYVRDWRLQLAEIEAANATARAADVDTRDVPPTVVQGLENPLSKLPLTGPAQFALGWSAQTGDLSPLRSGAALSQVLDDVDVCSYFIGLDNDARVLVKPEQFPGSYPMCGAREVPTPNDAVPLPTTTTGVPAETTTTVAG